MAASASSAGKPSVIPVDALRFEPSVDASLPLDKVLYQENRQRLCDALKATGVPAGSVVVLQGTASATRNETDHEPLLRQDSHFLWATGANLADLCLTINVDDAHATLFIPKLPASYAIWMGAIKTPAEVAAEYGINEGAFVSELGERVASAPRVLLNHGLNTDSGLMARPAAWDGSDALVESGVVDTEVLFPVLTECRVFKSERELAVMRRVVAAASDGHCVMMRAVREGIREDGLEAAFKFWMQSSVGARYNAYTYICGSGPNAAVLHYGHEGAPNDRTIGKDEFVLCDCGHELHGYASDITTTFPSSGTFTPDQRVVYSAVLASLEAVEAAMKPGVFWPDMQTLTYEVILASLRDAGVLKGEVADMMAANLGAVFMPHGLGHLIGIDTHDVGGYNGKDTPTRDTRDGYKSLRLARKLEKGMVLTAEPGCYFIDHLLDEALADPVRAAFLVPDVVARFRGIGGVRLEDNVIVTADGIENMVYVPRSIEEVEAMCAGKITSRDGFAKRHQA